MKLAWEHFLLQVILLPVAFCRYTSLGVVLCCGHLSVEFLLHNSIDVVHVVMSYSYIQCAKLHVITDNR